MSRQGAEQEPGEAGGQPQFSWTPFPEIPEDAEEQHQQADGRRLLGTEQHGDIVRPQSASRLRYTQRRAWALIQTDVKSASILALSLLSYA